MSAPILHVEPAAETLDLIPLLPEGTTGTAQLVRVGRVVTAQGQATLPKALNTRLVIPPRFAPTITGTLLLWWPWDTKEVKTQQWEGTAFRAGATPALPPAGRLYVAGSWVAA